MPGKPMDSYLECVTGPSLSCLSLPFSESLVRGLFSSLIQSGGVENEALEIATILGVRGGEEIKTVIKESPKDFPPLKTKDEGRKSHNLKLQGVQIKNEEMQIKQIQSSPGNDTQTGPCETCGKSVGDKETLKTHLKMHQDKNNPHKCNFCFKIFSNKYILSRHVQSHDPNAALSNPLEKVVCSQCPKICSNKYQLNAHIKTHEPGWVRKPEAPREKVKSLCSICSKWSPSRHQLMAHTRLLHGEKKYQPCSNCGLNFKVSSIRSHEKICKLSEEEKAAIKVECGECGKILANKVKLTRHIRFVHNNEKLLKCKLCDHKDYRDDNMKTHIKNRHQEEDPNKSYCSIKRAEEEKIVE